MIRFIYPICSIPLRALMVVLLAATFSNASLGQSPQALQQVAHDWLRQAVGSVQHQGDAALRMEVRVGTLDSRLTLAPCANVEPYLPAGLRLWGNTRVGLRCVDGMSRWNVTIPATVNAFGNAWVVKDQIPAGGVLTDANAMEVEVNWAQEASTVLADKGLWLGQVATRMLGTGQTLRQGMVKPAQVFQTGMQVRVVAQGTGFQISSDAQALSAGVVGQSARVRMDSGRVTSGMVLDMRTVRIDL